MTTSTCYLLVIISFSFHVTSYARLHPVVHPTQPQTRTGTVSPDIITKACEPSPEKAFCISVLKSQTVSDVSDLKQASFVAVQAASSEAVALSTMIKAARQREENKDVVEDEIEEETLADCATSYTSIVEMLANATSALLTGPEKDVSVEVKAAWTTADTCEKSIAGGRKSRLVEEVAKKNDNVKKFCSNALSVYEVFAKQGH